MAGWGGLLIKVCWIAWVAVWSGGWLYNLARGPRARTTTFQWTGLAILAAVLLTERMGGLAGAVRFRGPVPAAAGAVVLVGGTAFTLWARAVLGRMWSSVPAVKEAHQLRTAGPYAVTRHPIYTGMLAMVLGTLLMDGRLSTLLGAVAFLVYILVKMRVEERLMVATFGDGYLAYRRRTPQLVPWTRRLR